MAVVSKVGFWRVRFLLPRGIFPELTPVSDLFSPLLSVFHTGTQQLSKICPKKNALTRGAGIPNLDTRLRHRIQVNVHTPPDTFCEFCKPPIPFPAGSVTSVRRLHQYPTALQSFREISYPTEQTRTLITQPWKLPNTHD